MEKQMFLQLLAFCIIINYAGAQTTSSRVPYRIYDNFDTHETYAWEPYPYQQDTGYDPTFAPKKEPAYGGKGSSLARIVKPNDATDQSEGFTKRIDLYTNASTRLKFFFFMMSDRRPEKVDVSVGTWLVYKMKDPFMYKYVKPVWDAGGAGGRGGILPYMWYTQGITPIGREILPTSKHFVGKGHMVMRSDWDDAGSILIFKSGPNGNHYHYDQGHILLTYNGEELLSDAGHSSSYYANLYYPGYYTQSIGHNVMLVDMNAESQEPGDFDNGIAALRNYPKIIHAFAGEIASSVEGDLASVYKRKLSSYTRNILFSKTGPIFLFDRVKSPQEHTFDWIFHAEHTNGQSSILYTGNRMTITRPAARLTMDVLSPNNLTSRIRTSDRPESFISLSSGKMTDATFLAVMVPEAKPATGDFVARPKAVRIDAKGWIGANLKEDNAVYYGFFRVDGIADGTVEGFTTDATRFTATLENGKLSKAYFEGSNLDGHGRKVKFNVPVAAAIAFTDSGTSMEVKSARAAEVTLSASSAPAQVIVNGASVKTWKFDQKTGVISINLPAGESKVSFK